MAEHVWAPKSPDNISATRIAKNPGKYAEKMRREITLSKVITLSLFLLLFGVR
jgi:hypothetical protein